MKERIRELRKHLNMTMDEFGARIGLSKAAISLIESGATARVTRPFSLSAGSSV